ncbi:DUF3117 domain-containing protein [Streptomyces sp. Tu 3180]|nr:DUF3117 domain-containing protein [Streptomyces sp. Tu 3180]
MRVPIEGGGRVVIELTPDEAGFLAAELTNVVNDGEFTQPLSVRAWIWPRTGDGPFEVTQEGRGAVIRVPIEGGGRVVIELTPDEAGFLAAELTNVVG